jgi:G patch domain-containing protein 1
MGNTRWQGAFTGGFSAGYKNTVGSKEGWQPAQFVSSQSRRAEKKEQNVLDFMDKEDLVIFFII